MPGLACAPRLLLLAIPLMAAACTSGAAAPSTSHAARGESSTSSASAPQENEAIFLWSIPVQASAEARALPAAGVSESDIGRSLRIVFEQDGSAPDELRRRFPRLALGEDEPGKPKAEGASAFTIAPLVEQPQPVQAERREATFVIDHDEPAVQTLLAELPSSARTPAALEEFVARTLTESHGRGFDIASRVATLRKGDCTEHAVLLTALLRASGFSARVVVGVVVVLGADLAVAAGHAWVEYAEEGLWRRLDAALYRDSAGNWGDTDGAELGSLDQAARIYFSTIVLEDEGPGYTRELMQYVFDYAPRALKVSRFGP